ncbi:biliverdin-producing heme oxygenase [Streptomyces sp. PmtG]
MDSEIPQPTPLTPTPFSAVIRTASHEQHTEAETSTFMGDLLGGRLGVDAYARYTEQLWFVYRALEDGAEALRDDPVAGPFIRPELLRVAELERDLAHLRGAGWRERATALPATAAYAERVAQCARTWPGGYVAHHYTRYLGDLSGGQIIRDKAEKTWGFAKKGDGVRFYVFDGIANPAAFKRSYRELLDGIDVVVPDELERHRIVEECKRAFALNTAVFAALGHEFPRAA